jgi:hypothetical protein
MNTPVSRAPNRLLWSALAAALLAGCGGGNDPAPPPATLSGVAAIGAPIVNGSVAVKCGGGPALSTTTNTSGAWQVQIAGQTLPCAVQVSGGTVGGSANTTPYHSIAVTFGTVNITPLTDLIVAQLTQANPQTWFGTPVFTSVNASAVGAAFNSMVTGLGIRSTLGSVDPITTPFAAKTGDPVDNLLEAFRVALATVGQNYAAVLRAAQLGNYNGFAAFAGAFGNAVAQINAPVVTPPVVPPVTPPTAPPTTPPVVPPIAGGRSVTVEVSVAGVVSTVTVDNVPAPTNQADFCNSLQNDATVNNITAAGGSLRINSCSFANNVGQISATLTTTVPIALSLPYSLRYTYN